MSVVIFSHRGLLNGYDGTIENSLEAIDKAINAGFNVEIDIRYQDSTFFLGHDKIQYPVSSFWIHGRKKHLLIHCKDIVSCYKLSTIVRPLVNYFCHNQDEYVLVSDGSIWVHNIKLPLNNKCIIPLITKEDVENYKGTHNLAGVCTDFPILANQKFNQ